MEMEIWRHIDVNVISGAGTRPLAASLHWTGEDPLAVTLIINDSDAREQVPWTFALDLLRTGYNARVEQPAGIGDVRICGYAGKVLIHLHGPCERCAEYHRQAIISLRTDDVLEFLADVPTGVELSVECVDQTIAKIFATTWR